MGLWDDRADWKPGGLGGRWWIAEVFTVLGYIAIWVWAIVRG